MKTRSTLDVFKNYYSTLADNIFKKLPTPLNKYTFNSVIQYYRRCVKTDAFLLTYTTKNHNRKILRTTNICKAAVMKDDSKTYKWTVNFYIKLGGFRYSCKIAKSKTLFKKGPKTNSSKYRPILLLPLRMQWRVIFANIIDCFRSQLWVGCFIYFKFTPVFFCLMFLMDVL